MVLIRYYTVIHHVIVRVLKDSEAMFLSIFFNLIPLVAVIVAIWRHFQWCCSPPYLVYSSPIHTYCTKRVALFMISKATSARGNPLDRCSLLISAHSSTIFPMSPPSPPPIEAKWQHAILLSLPHWKLLNYATLYLAFGQNSLLSEMPMHSHGEYLDRYWC